MYFIYSIKSIYTHIKYIYFLIFFKYMCVHCDLEKRYYVWEV